MAQLRLDGVNVAYGAVTALSDVSMSVEPATVTVILGANGAGKSSLVNAVAGLVRIRSGTITLDGQRVDHLSPEARVRRGIALSPEGRRVFPEMTVAENLTIGGFARRRGRAQRVEMVYAHFPILARRRSQTAGTLSGGEQQMLAIGRALMAKPRLLLLDEPSLGLAPAVVELIAETIPKLVKEEGIAILLSEQNAGLGLNIADHAYVLRLGRIVMSGPAESMRSNEAVREAYLGSDR